MQDIDSKGTVKDIFEKFIGNAKTTNGIFCWV